MFARVPRPVGELSRDEAVFGVRNLVIFPRR
jgi:hypothetical protein